MEAVLLGIGIPMRPVPVACVVSFVFNLASWNAERDSLIRFSSDLGRGHEYLNTGITELTHDEILIRFVRWFLSLLPSTHEPPPRNDIRLDLRQMHLDHHPLFPSIHISDFRHPITRSSNFEENFALYCARGRSDHQL